MVNVALIALIGTVTLIGTPALACQAEGKSEGQPKTEVGAVETL